MNKNAQKFALTCIVALIALAIVAYIIKKLWWIFLLAGLIAVYVTMKRLKR